MIHVDTFVNTNRTSHLRDTGIQEQRTAQCPSAKLGSMGNHERNFRKRINLTVTVGIAMSELSRLEVGAV